MGRHALIRNVIADREPVTEDCMICGAGAKLRVYLSDGGILPYCGHDANARVETILRIADTVAIDPGFKWRGEELATISS